MKSFCLFAVVEALDLYVVSNYIYDAGAAGWNQYHLQNARMFNHNGSVILVCLPLLLYAGSLFWKKNVQ
jgi:hypothetical protein